MLPGDTKSMLSWRQQLAGDSIFNISISTRWVISATLVLATALGIGRFAYTPLLPDMVQTFGWTFADAGDVASANFLGYMVGALLAPRITSSAYVRLWVAASLVASVGTTYLGAEVTTLNSWLVIRFLSGVASAFCLVVITTRLIQVLHQEKTEHLGNVHFAGVGVGILLCMFAVYMPGDIAVQWARLGAMGAFIMAIAWFLIADQTFSIPAVPVPHQGHDKISAHLWRLIAGYGFFGFGYVVAATFVVAMAGSLQTPDFDARSVWLVVGLSLVPSVYIWQWLSNRYGLLKSLRAAYLVEAVGVVLAGLSTSVGWLVFACVLLGGTFGAITALGISAAKEAAPTRVAFTVSAMTIAFALGQLLGPAISGRMADLFGDFMWPSIAAATLLMAAAALIRKPAQ